MTESDTNRKFRGGIADGRNRRRANFKKPLMEGITAT